MTDGDGGDAISSVDDIEDAMVYIEVSTVFADPEIGAVEGDFSGSGFIIDPSGLAVTNNHVVTGAATLEVRVGDEDETRDAQIVAVSECSDLALIDIEGEDFPYLDWYGEEASPGLDVYAAGYPGGDEFTLTSGIISQAADEYATYHASVDSVLQHDADLDSGNSGGPLVTEDGEVVGINYFVDAQTAEDFSWEFLAIASDEASEVVETLKGEENVDWLGINGQAVFDDTTGQAGVWVAGVESGSPAADVGLEPGDIVIKMEGIGIGVDGTMADYCDVIRTHGQDDPMSIQVLRYSTDEILEGTLNDEGGELTLVSSLGSQLADTYDAPAGSGSYSEYVYITDDLGELSVEVPAEWSDVDGAPLTLEDGSTAPSVWASPSLDDFISSWGTPGMMLNMYEGAGDDATQLTELLTQLGGDDCTDTPGQESYEDALYVGIYEWRGSCGQGGAALVGFVGGPEDGSFTLALVVQLTSEADYEALDRILASFVALNP